MQGTGHTFPPQVVHEITRTTGEESEIEGRQGAVEEMIISRSANKSAAMHNK